MFRYYTQFWNCLEKLPYYLFSSELAPLSLREKIDMQGEENKVPIPFTMQEMPFLLTECLNTKSHKLRGYSYLEGIYQIIFKD